MNSYSIALFLVLILRTVNNPVFADASIDDGIYGWAFRCTAPKIKIAGRQADDDFFFSARGIAKFPERIYAREPGPDYSLKVNPLIFKVYGTSDETKRKLADTFGIVIKRDERNLDKPGMAAAIARFNGIKYKLTCEVRFGRDEDDFDNQKLAEWADVSKKW